eukprot:g55186.t1
MLEVLFDVMLRQSMGEEPVAEEIENVWGGALKPGDLCSKCGEGVLEKDMHELTPFGLDCHVCGFYFGQA